MKIKIIWRLSWPTTVNNKAAREVAFDWSIRITCILTYFSSSWLLQVLTVGGNWLKHGHLNTIHNNWQLHFEENDINFYTSVCSVHSGRIMAHYEVQINFKKSDFLGDCVKVIILGISWSKHRLSGTISICHIVCLCLMNSIESDSIDEQNTSIPDLSDPLMFK